MVKIKRQNITSVSDDMEKLNNSYIVIEMKLKQPNCKTMWQLLKLLNIDLPYDIAVLLSALYPKEKKKYVQKCLHQHY